MLASIPARTLNPIRSRRGIPRFSLFGKCSKASGVGAKDRQCLIQRTAVYGPVRTVVWEGRSREAPPIPILRRSFHECLLLACAVKRRRFPVGASPTRQPLQPEAIGAVMEVTKWLKPSISVSRIGDSASVQAATRVNAEQA